MTQFAIFDGSAEFLSTFGALARPVAELNEFFQVAARQLGVPSHAWVPISPRFAEGFIEALTSTSGTPQEAEADLLNFLQQAVRFCDQIWLWYGSDWTELHFHEEPNAFLRSIETQLRDPRGEVYACLRRGTVRPT